MECSVNALKIFPWIESESLQDQVKKGLNEQLNTPLSKTEVVGLREVIKRISSCGKDVMKDIEEELKRSPF